MSDSKDQVTVQTGEPASPSLPKDSAVTVVQSSPNVQTENEDEPSAPADKLDEQKKGFFAFLKTKEFYIILALGYLFAKYVILFGAGS